MTKGYLIGEDTYVLKDADELCDVEKGGDSSPPKADEVQVGMNENIDLLEKLQGWKERRKEVKLKDFSWARYLTSLTVWYGASTTITLYIKWFHSEEGHGFKYPLFSTSISLAVQSALALMMVMLKSGRFHIPLMVGYEEKTLILAGIFAGLDLGLSNSGLNKSTLSLYTVVRSTTPLFTLIVAHYRRIEKVTPALVVLTLFVTIGVILTAIEEFTFNLSGFIYSQISTIVSAFRWVTIQDLILSSTYPPEFDNLDTSFLVITYILPISSIICFILSMIIDGPRAIFSSPAFSSLESTAFTISLIDVTSLLGLIVLSAEHFSLTMISALAFILIGITKEIIILTIAFTFYGETVTNLKIIGIFISIISLMIFQYIRSTKKSSPP